MLCNILMVIGGLSLLWIVYWSAMALFSKDPVDKSEALVLGWGWILLPLCYLHDLILELMWKWQDRKRK